MQIKGVNFQSPGRSDLSRDDSNMGDDSSSMGAKEEDEDDENDEDLEDNSGDPERLKAFNVRKVGHDDENGEEDEQANMSSLKRCHRWKMNIPV